MNYRLLAVAALAGAALSACVTQPQPLQGEFAPLTPRQASDQDSSGALVRWGGHIVQVEPKPDSTCFEILSTKLDAHGRPYWSDEQTGTRFIACRPGFYDPALFKVNRQVSFTGRIDGYENRRIGGYDYRFPHVTADVVYLWPQRERNQAASSWPWWGRW